MVRMMTAGLTMAGVFGLTAGLLLYLIPKPHKPTDYLVIGTVSTFASMAALFLMAFLAGRKK